MGEALLEAIQMLPYPMPANENERIAALERCGVLDTPPERLFDDIALLAGQLCRTPIALVSFVDRTRQWFKARIGLELAETPRAASLCAHAIVAHGPLVVRDALADARFAHHPLVTAGPRIRFYAAAPLVLDGGYALGTVCVMDRVPRELTSMQLESLAVLARRASAELSLRDRLTNHEAPQPLEHESADATPSGAATHPYSQRQRARVAASDLPVPPGTLVGGRYRIERAIGAGGMGVVAAALDVRRYVRVAIKFMRPSALAQPPALRRFAREAQVLVALDSEHVARVLDFGRLADESPFIVMEHLSGTDLAAHLRQEGRLSIEPALAIMLQACEAVQSAHTQGILHRDLKPANLFLTRARGGRLRVKVLDFGISKLASAHEAELETALTGEATELGSPSYMSPEQMLRAAEVDVRSDVWSLGVVLYELLAGRTPFGGPSRIETCANVLTSELPSLQELRPDLPAELVATVERCLEKQPERRFQTVAELGSALEQIAHMMPRLHAQRVQHGTAR